MKKAMILSVILITGMFYLAVPVSLQAQDDLYYNPRDNRNVSNVRGGSTDTYAYDDSGYNDGYDNDMYDYYDDYDYQYSTRIRRFNRVNPGFGYYDPFFVDPFFYDPFMMAHYNPFMYRPFNPWVRGHRFRMMHCPFGMGMGMGMGMGFGYNPWGMGMGYNPWGMGMGMGMGMGYNPWGMGMGMGMGMGYNPWGMGYGMPFYGNGMGWGNQGYWDGGGFNGGTTPNTVYTPRRGGAVTTTDRATVRQPQADRSDRVREADQANRDVQTGGRLTPQTGDQGRNTVRNPVSAAPDQPVSAGEQRLQGADRPQDATPSRRFFTVDRNNPDNRQAPSMDRSGQDMNQRGNMRQAPPVERQDNRRIQSTPRSRENTPSRNNNSGGNMRSMDRSSSPSMSPPARSSSPSMSTPSRSSSPSMSSPSRSSSPSMSSPSRGGGGGGGGRTSPRG